jgi:hypothetical protein
MKNDEQRLDRLLAAYREAWPDPEPSEQFMPALWSKIDARRGFTLTLRRWTGALVAAATTACVAMAVYMATPHQAEPNLHESTYVDSLAQDESFEAMAFAELVSFDRSEGADNR